MADKDFDVDLEKVIVAFMQNVDVKDRRFRLKTYKKCFIGKEAVDFLVQSGISANREEAVKLGQYLQESKGLIRHVTGDHSFSDAHLFFEFTPAAYPAKPAPSFSTSAVYNLYGVKEATEEEGEGRSFADQRRKKLLNDTGAPSEVKKDLVLAAAEKAIKDLSMAQKINNQLVVDSAGLNSPFETQIKPSDMRCLALVAHNHMKPAMRAFIEGHSEILKKFRLTGTNTTMTMCRTVFGEDNEEVEYGPRFTSGPLGGDAQLAALLCLEDVGAIFFFMDPLSPHPHQADIDSLVRLSNVHNIILCPNPTTAVAMMWMMRQSLVNNKPEMFPSFFQTLESPSVQDYKAGQKAALEKAIQS